MLRKIFAVLILHTINDVSYACDLKNESDLFTLKKKWDKYVLFVLSYWGWNRVAIKDFLEWGIDGHNNERLWHDSEANVFDLMNDAQWDMHYCSDRMSLDRLFRINWVMNNAIQNQCNDDGIKPWEWNKAR